LEVRGAAKPLTQARKILMNPYLQPIVICVAQGVRG
jgi:hypothetical protein